MILAIIVRAFLSGGPAALRFRDHAEPVDNAVLSEEIEAERAISGHDGDERGQIARVELGRDPGQINGAFTAIQRAKDLRRARAGAGRRMIQRVVDKACTATRYSSGVARVMMISPS
ncbi:hypothetical protein [Paenirhodobacter populi]|uniref:hypothetical protein n=1 Tax=Paenirhodobacter populi TaxID=2306993 RepID=UPI000FE2B8A4|nr:hypothetical protein [Sinirhodobacter populi]RWR05005.1 hypothetical protein D2T32_18210 [Sinirhodobacter populi]